METKPALTSKGVWGGLLALVISAAPTYGPPILGLFGVKDPEAQAAIVQAVVGIGGSIAGLLAIWGRGTAKTALR
ncbi:MAG: hypothetical protein ACK4YQ_08315 [Phenylobacterium sp.]|uniref:hypothetical protein n=1 Tax=Phenylobacterium sp. TaxID=1871053 RepID=UPI00391CA772